MAGRTLLTDVWCKDKYPLRSKDILVQLVKRIADVACMTLLDHTLQVEFFPVWVDGRLAGDYGVSCGAIIVESHIYLHTWPEKYYCRLEVSSCKSFDAERVVQVVEHILGATQIKWCCVDWQES